MDVVGVCEEGEGGGKGLLNREVEVREGGDRLGWMGE